MVQILKGQYLEKKCITSHHFKIKLQFKYQLKAHKKYFRMIMMLSTLTCWREKKRNYQRNKLEVAKYWTLEKLTEVFCHLINPF